MRHIVRRPLLPCLLLVVLAFGVCFMALFQESIRGGQAAVSEMYDSVQLTFQVLPGASDNGVLKLRNTQASAIRALDEVTGCSYYLACPYTLREPMHIANLSQIYGANDLGFFSTERGIDISFGDGWTEERLMKEAAGAIPCLLEENLAAVLGVGAGDTFTIAPNHGEGRDPAAAPSLVMVAAGTFANSRGLVETYGIIVSDRYFTSSPGLLYNGDMMASHYYYRAFHFQIDPACNREYDRIYGEIEDLLAKSGNFILYSNVRTLEQAVRPIEQKLRLQQLLVVPLSAAFCAAAALVTLLLSLSFGEEVFLRSLWGEKRGMVCLKMTLSVCVLLLFWGVLSLAAVGMAAGTAWIPWGARYLLLALLLCFAAAAIPQGIYGGRNLVRFYQSREG